MEIAIGSNINNKSFCGMEYKGFSFFRTANKVWASEKLSNGKWRGLGRAGFEYIVINNGSVFTFYTLREVKAFINAHIALVEANKVMNGILKGVVRA